MKSGRLLAATALALSCSLGAVSPAQAQIEPYISQLMVNGYNFCPRGWAETNGQLISIAQNTALFSLIGTTYGGNGQTTFALPDLRGRTPIHVGQGPGLSPIQLGQTGGITTTTLVLANLPAHTHAPTVRAFAGAGNSAQPVRNYFANAAGGELDFYAGPSPINNMAVSSIAVAPTGGNSPVEIRDPYLGMRWCIAVEGIFPSRN